MGTRVVSRVAIIVTHIFLREFGGLIPPLISAPEPPSKVEDSRSPSSHREAEPNASVRHMSARMKFQTRP